MEGEPDDQNMFFVDTVVDPKDRVEVVESESECDVSLVGLMQDHLGWMGVWTLLMRIGIEVDVDEKGYDDETVLKCSTDCWEFRRKGAMNLQSSDGFSNE